jgi:endonuclease/exonuclease/phosphatase family metal-dependent hydrolase
VATGPRPVALLGDFNAAPTAAEIQLVTRDLADAWALAGSGDGFTFDARTPRVRIDYVLVSSCVHVRSAVTVPTSASDHLPVVVDVVVASAHEG